MEDKHTALVILSVIVVIAIVGMVMLFSAAKTGDVVYAGSKTYANTQGNPFPYYEDALHTTGIQKRSTGQIDWDWRKAPEHTYGAKMGRCAILATSDIAKVPAGYIMDANYQESVDYMSMGRDCIRVTDSQDGYCCTLS